MSGNFKGQPIVPTRSYARQDSALPSLGTIQLLPSSLLSQEQDLVQGDVRRAITGNVFYNLTGNRSNTTTANVTDLILANHNYTLGNQLTHTVNGPTNEIKHGAHTHQNSSTRNDTFIGSVSRFFQDTTKEIHPEQWLQKWNNYMAYKDFSHKASSVDVSLAYVSKISMSTSTVTARVTGLKVGGAELDLKTWRVNIEATSTKIRAQASKLVCTALLIGVLELGTPFKPNALPRPTPITPLD